MTIEINIQGASAEEIKTEIAKLFSGSNLTVGEVAPLTVTAATEEVKAPTKKKAPAKTDEPKTEPAPETGAHGYTYEDIQKLAAEVEDKPQIKALVPKFNQEDGTPCERMSQVQPKDWAAFAGGLKLILDNQI